MTKGASRDFATPLMAVLFAGVGAVVIWDTTTYTDADSYVFPRTIALVMIGLSVLLVIQWLLGWDRNSEAETGMAAAPVMQSTPRRIALVAAMIGAALLMPVLGFLITGLIAFAVILLAAMYDPWTPYRLIVYPISGAIIVASFYVLFSQVLNVPLPEAAWPF